MADEELIRAGLDALQGVMGVLIEDAHDLAVSRAPEEAGERLARVGALSRLEPTVVALTRACEVLLRRNSQAREVVDET
jgi:hypothetical protein